MSKLSKDFRKDLIQLHKFIRKFIKKSTHLDSSNTQFVQKKTQLILILKLINPILKKGHFNVPETLDGPVFIVEDQGTPELKEETEDYKISAILGLNFLIYIMPQNSLKRALLYSGIYFF